MQTEKNQFWQNWPLAKYIDKVFLFFLSDIVIFT